VKTKASILISTHNNIALLRRALWSIATRPPDTPYEVILCDDGSEDNILKMLRDEFASAFPWKFIKVSISQFEKRTGIKNTYHNPAWTNNVAFRHSKGEFIYLMNSNVIVWDKAFSQLLPPICTNSKWMTLSTTYKLDQRWWESLDAYGSNLTNSIVQTCNVKPLQSELNRTDVTNYLSVCPRSLWEKVGGYDERYAGGIGYEGPDFVRRVRVIGATATVMPNSISLYQQPSSELDDEQYVIGEKNNQVLYEAWDGTYLNPQNWLCGNVGVMEISDNFTPIKAPPLITTAKEIENV
jgi:GT2 family glycosyltransferase